MTRAGPFFFPHRFNVLFLVLVLPSLQFHTERENVRFGSRQGVVVVVVVVVYYESRKRELKI